MRSLICEGGKSFIPPMREIEHNLLSVFVKEQERQLSQAFFSMLFAQPSFTPAWAAHRPWMLHSAMACSIPGFETFIITINVGSV